MSSSSPGGADPAAVARAAAALSPLGDMVVAGGSVGALTTYRVGGAAALLITVTSVDDLALVRQAQAGSGLPVLVVGRGSNLLVADAGFGGLAVVLDQTAFGTIDTEGLMVTAGGAAALPTLARQSVEAGWHGLEWAVGVPGSVGGGVRMNAGGHGSDMAHVLDSCDLFDLMGPEDRVQTRVAAGMDFGYRHSAVTPGMVVTEARFKVSPGDPESGRQTIRQIVHWRREHQPGGQNAGSVFTNPPDDSAGRLIDTAGLKGRRVRSAMVSPKHANFIQADTGGSADDVRALMELVVAEVAACHGVTLVPEVRMVGFDADSPSAVERDS